MNINQKLIFLDDMYNTYNELIKDMNFTCKKHCCHCCTSNLTTTTLEAYKILSHLKEKEYKIDKLKSFKHRRHFIPNITINKMAEICAYGNNLPKEKIDHNTVNCAFLSNNKECDIYNYRPFGCRCMLSTGSCAERGCADIDPYLLTVNSVFIQYIEHIDCLGYTSNLIDTMLVLSYKNNIYQYENNFNLTSTNNLIKNQMIHTLVVPSEHIKQIQPLLENIKKKITLV